MGSLILSSFRRIPISPNFNLAEFPSRRIHRFAEFPFHRIRPRRILDTAIAYGRINNYAWKNKLYIAEFDTVDCCVEEHFTKTFMV